MKHVYIDWDTYGYTVIVTDDDNNELYRYDAGNCLHESSPAYRLTADCPRVSRSQLGKWARQTGREIAEEHSAKYHGFKAPWLRG